MKTLQEYLEEFRSKFTTRDEALGWTEVKFKNLLELEAFLSQMYRELSFNEEQRGFLNNALFYWMKHLQEYWFQADIPNEVRAYKSRVYQEITDKLKVSLKEKENKS